MSDSWEQLKRECAACQNCPLGGTRTRLVFGVGSETAEVLFVGEGPGEQEDLRGEPFVGPAGQLLDDMLHMIGLDRSRVYIANVVKCRPPHNRDPQLIVCLGRIAAMALIDPAFRITREHGQWFERNGRRIMATYHPSALLRDTGKRPEAFMDLRELRKEIRARCPNTEIVYDSL